MTLSHPALRIALAAATLAVSACSSMPMSMGGGASDPNSAHFVATLSGSGEVPPNTTGGTGSLDATLDKSSSTLSWKLTYSGLTGPATAAHFHGPAAPGANAPVVVPFPSPDSPAQGQALLTPSQVADLTAGKWYVNVHTAANKGGEIRGQVTLK